MIELILLIMSLQNGSDIQSKNCLDLMYSSNEYVTTYKNKRIYWRDIFNKICSEEATYEYAIRVHP